MMKKQSIRKLVNPSVTPKKRRARKLTNRSLAITPVEYGGLQEAYDHFNTALFGDTLPDVFITYQRRAHSRGYFSADRFSARNGEFGRHELALNPDAFVDRSDEQICSTLAHEMTHVWQQQHGAPSRGYHNREWAAKMKAIGLQPSSTGAVGGKETGHRITHYIVAGGLFTKAYHELASTGWKLNLQSASQSNRQAKSRNSKTKFNCACGQNVWGKPDLAIVCELCGDKMQAAA
jgi:predicted SprT family Zn-dependent metalloprotease